jgi:hypothetical protein
MQVVWIRSNYGSASPQVWHPPTGWLQTMKNTHGHFSFPSMGGERIICCLDVAPEDEHLSFDELVAKYPLPVAS